MSSLIEESTFAIQLKDNLAMFNNIMNSNQATKHAFLIKAEALCHQIVDNMNELEIDSEVSNTQNIY
jgi:hypothetical protein